MTNIRACLTKHIATIAIAIIPLTLVSTAIAKPPRHAPYESSSLSNTKKDVDRGYPNSQHTSNAESSQNSNTRVMHVNYKTRPVKFKKMKLIEHVLKKMSKKIDLKMDSQKINALLSKGTKGQQAIFSVSWFSKSVRTGGIDYYFSTKASDLIPTTKMGLRLIGATEHLQALNQALKVYVDDEYALDYVETRRDILRGLSESEKDSFFESVDNKLTELEENNVLVDLMDKYISEHPEQFFTGY